MLSDLVGHTLGMLGALARRTRRSLSTRAQGEPIQCVSLRRYHDIPCSGRWCTYALGSRLPVCRLPTRALLIPNLPICGFPSQSPRPMVTAAGVGLAASRCVMSAVYDTPRIMSSEDIKYYYYIYQ